MNRLRIDINALASCKPVTLYYSYMYSDMLLCCSVGKSTGHSRLEILLLLLYMHVPTI